MVKVHKKSNKVKSTFCPSNLLFFNLSKKILKKSPEIRLFFLSRSFVKKFNFNVSRANSINNGVSKCYVTKKCHIN